MSTPQYRPQYQGYAPTPAKTNALAIIGLISVLFIYPVGIVVGHIALSQIKTTGERGRGVAIVALVIGYVLLLAYFLGGIILLWAAHQSAQAP
ncbi:DUF4190 domain-containing protein [Arthrobacter sp. R1-13]